MTRKSAPSGALPRGVALATAFAAGWVIMQLEILGGRALAPWFGYSVYQWGALIGVVMAALAAGYWLGGRLGDGPKAGRFLFAALSISALFVVIVPPFSKLFMPAFGVLGPGWGAAAATAVLLGLPSVLLATTSPIVARLTSTGMIAETAGRVYAVSTAGSIAGTFFTAFYIIPTLGSRMGHFVAAGIIVVAAAGLGVSQRRMIRLAVVVAVGASMTQIGPAREKGVLYRGESVHNIIKVQDIGHDRFLFLNYDWGGQSVMNKEGILTGRYYDDFLLGPRINGGRRVLFLGSAGGVAPKQLTALYPDVRVTAVELDPKVIAVAKRYFGLDDAPRIRQVAADARWYLSAHEARYDIVDIDLYITGNIPFFAATREFFALVYNRLDDDGVMMMNILSMRPGPELVQPFVRTVRTVFPSTFLVGRGNYILIASKRPLSLRALRERLQQPDARSELETVARRALASLRAASAGPEWPVFTDDRNDVEFRSYRMNRPTP